MTSTPDQTAAIDKRAGGSGIQPGLDVQLALIMIGHILDGVRREPGQQGWDGTRGGLAPYQLRRVQEHMEQNLSDDVRLAELTELAGLSPSHFCHAFKRSTGLTPGGWLRGRRVARAQELLRSTSLPLSEIALVCGFADQAHFSRTFRDFVGHPPGAWRRAHRA